MIRPRVWRWVAIGACAAPCVGQPPCLPPSDVGRHPLFGGVSIRPDFELIDGEPAVGVATGAAFGDLDGDGRPDAVVATDRYITVLLSRGGGVFAPPTAYEVGDRETFVEIADMDRDGNLDVLVCNALSDSIGVLFGRADGTLGDPVTYAGGDEPQSLVVDDFNTDGALDVAILNVKSSDVWVYLNDGDGGLLEHARIAIEFVTPRGESNRTFAYPGPYLASGDLNGDGHADLAIPARGRVHLLLGDGLGGFEDSAAHPRSPVGSVYDIELADLNGDGALDIASSIATGPSWMVVWLNEGQGSFPEADAYESSWAGRGPLYFNVGLAIGDFSADGFLDIALASERQHAVPVHLNLGDGTFADADAKPTYEGSWFVDTLDANGDGTVDLAIVSEDVRGALRIRLADGRGDLLGPVRMPVTVPLDGFGNRRALVTTDLDGDGDWDLVAGLGRAQNVSTRVELYENDGGGQFELAGSFDLSVDTDSAVMDLLAADLDGDGLPEILVADTIINTGWVDPGILWIMENRGDLAFDVRVVHEFADTYPTRLAAHDFDGDGRLDLVVHHHELWPGEEFIPIERQVMILRNLGGLRFEPVANWTIGALPWSPNYSTLAVGDVTGDGTAEIVAGLGRRLLPGELAVYRHDGGFAFTEIARTATTPHAKHAVVADLDHDGRQEIALVHDHNRGGIETEPYLTTFRMTDKLQAIESWSDPSLLTEGNVASEDLDRDGNPDLIMGVIGGQMAVQLGCGDGTFGPPVSYGTLHSSFTVAVADFNADGRPDFASSTFNEDITVQYGASCYTPCPADLTGSSDPREPTYGVPDLDVDSDDFFFYLDTLASGNLSTCDLDHDGDCDAQDFFAYLDLFAAGCP